MGKRKTLDEEYEVDKIVEMRVLRGGSEFLVSWKGYDADGDTWEPAQHLPPALVKAFLARRARLPQSFGVVIHLLRDRVARQLLESKGPKFGVKFDVEIAALPEYAAAVLDFFSRPPRGAAAGVCELKTYNTATQVVRQLVITDIEHAAWLVGLHNARPEHGVGALRIKAGGAANNDMMLVACTETSPLLLEHRVPKSSSADGPIEGTYTFKVTFSTAKINGHSGDFRPYTAPSEDLQLDEAQAEKLVAYCKRTVKQPWSAKPIPHPFRTVWANLPAGQWLLP